MEANLNTIYHVLKVFVYLHFVGADCIIFKIVSNFHHEGLKPLTAFNLGKHYAGINMSLYFASLILFLRIEHFAQVTFSSVRDCLPRGQLNASEDFIQPKIFPSNEAFSRTSILHLSCSPHLQFAEPSMPTRASL